MASLARDDLEAALKKKGFDLEKRDHRFYFFRYKGLNRAVVTKVSNGKQYKTIDKSTVGKIARQLQLTTAQLGDLVSCPMGHAEYVTHLKQRGIIEKSDD